MAEGQYCIVDNTINPNLSIEGLVGFTMEEALEWIEENQVALEEELVVDETTYTHKFSIQPDSWPVPTEEAPAGE
jgi:hypothetical protein